MTMTVGEAIDVRGDGERVKLALALLEVCEEYDHPPYRDHQFWARAFLRSARARLEANAATWEEAKPDES